MVARRSLSLSIAVVLAAALLVGGARGGAAPAGPSSRLVTIDVDRELGPLNHDLVGFGLHEGGAPVSTIAALRPHLVRIDASLQEVSTGPDDPLHLEALLSRIAEIRAIGGEPLVILSYLPAWLGAPNAGGRDPTRVAPADLDAWQALVHDVVSALATAPLPALRFEAWNEPDVPLFWQDSPAAWVDTVERSARAVAAVEAETGLDLAFGGPATAVPDPIYLVPFLTRFRDTSLPLDFVSWHYYGNYPFFGPDGAEFPLTEPIHPVLGQQNPFTSPADYAPQVDFVRGLSEVALAGSGRAVPDLVIDEWNLSAAGFDLRHDTASGAAFAAGVLVELQDAGLDAAAFFRANDTQGVPGEHGIVTIDAITKPVWWAFWFWQGLAATQVAVDPARRRTDDVWAVASRDGDHVTVLLAAFRASPVAAAAPGSTSAPLQLRLVGSESEETVMATVRTIGDGRSPSTPQPAAVEGRTIAVDLPNPGVVLVDVVLGGTEPAPPTANAEPTIAATAGTSPDQPALPATGEDQRGVAAIAAAAAALALARLRRLLAH